MRCKPIRDGIFTANIPQAGFGAQLTAYSDGALGQTMKFAPRFTPRFGQKFGTDFMFMHGLGADTEAYFAPASIVDAATGNPVIAPIVAATGKPVVVGALAGSMGLALGFALGGLAGYLIGKRKRSA